MKQLLALGLVLLAATGCAGEAAEKSPAETAPLTPAEQLREFDGTGEASEYGDHLASLAAKCDSTQEQVAAGVLKTQELWLDRYGENRPLLSVLADLDNVVPHERRPNAESCQHLFAAYVTIGE